MRERLFQVSFDGQPAADEFYAKLIELEVDDRAGEPDTFRLKVGLRRDDDGAWEDLDADEFALFTKVRIEAGFAAAGMEVLTEGYITDVRAHFEDPAGHPHLEVLGMDAAVLMTLEEKIVAWPNLSDSAIATQILGSYQFTPDVTSTDPVHQEADVTLIQRGTDLQFLRMLARRHGFEVGVEPGAFGVTTGYFRPPPLDGTPQKALSVAFDERSSLARFDVRVDGLRPLAAEAQQIDVKGKQAASGSAASLQLTAIGSDDLEALVGGKVGSLVTAHDTAGKVWLAGHPTSDATELAALAQAVRDEAGWLATASGDVRTDVYGAVLHADRLVLVKGAGARYSGTYFVTRVTHRLTSAGVHEQHFAARRNAVGVQGTESFADGGALL